MSETLVVRELQSSTVASLVKSLVNVQRKIKDAQLDKVNPHFKNRYATLESILDEIRPTCTEFGLAFTQTVLDDNVLVTTLFHESGEWIRSYLKLNPTKNDPQGFGSALTYGRRYSLTAMLGIGQGDQEDDDGEAASVDDLKSLKLDQFLAKLDEHFGGKVDRNKVGDLLKSKFDWNTDSKRVMFDYVVKMLGSK